MSELLHVLCFLYSKGTCHRAKSQEQCYSVLTFHLVVHLNMYIVYLDFVKVYDIFSHCSCPCDNNWSSSKHHRRQYIYCVCKEEYRSHSWCYYLFQYFWYVMSVINTQCTVCAEGYSKHNYVCLSVCSLHYSSIDQSKVHVTCTWPTISYNIYGVI